MAKELAKCDIWDTRAAHTIEKSWNKTEGALDFSTNITYWGRFDIVRGAASDVLGIKSEEVIRDMENCGSMVTLIGNKIVHWMTRSDQGFIVFFWRVIGNIYDDNFGTISTEELELGLKFVFSTWQDMGGSLGTYIRDMIYTTDTDVMQKQVGDPLVVEVLVDHDKNQLGQDE